MKHSLALIFLLTIFLAAPVRAQDNSVLIRELLDLPAPRPPATQEKKEGRDANFYGGSAPADDAPIEDLWDYWLMKGAASYVGDEKSPTASPQTALRLIEASGDKLGALENFIKIFPPDPDVAESLNAVLNNNNLSDGADIWHDKIKTWLKFNSTIYLDEVADEARRAKDHSEYLSIVRADSLYALSKFDWKTAGPLLGKLAGDTANPRTAVLAIGLLYQHAEKEKDSNGTADYREKLQAVVSDKTAKASARNLAMEILADSDWPGRDDWYLSLFEDEGLLKPEEDRTGYRPLKAIARKDPDKWIPILAKLVGNKNRAVHNAAVENLMSFRRKDALLPLVPWLSDPEWSDADGRIHLMQYVGDLDMPESVPGLIWIIENQEYEAKWASKSISALKDPRAIPALRFRLEKTIDEDDRTPLLTALLACGGLKDLEMVAAIEAYANATLKPGGIFMQWQINPEGSPLPLQVSIGRFLAGENELSENFVRLLFLRISDLEKDTPELAAKLSQLAGKWRGKAVYAEMLQRVADGKADGPMMVAILAQRKEIRESAPLELSWLTGKSGYARALGLAVLEDENALTGMIDPADPASASVTFAFARLIRLKLPPRDVAPLLKHQNKLLALAAERYLESENSVEARQAIYALHSGEMPILGPRKVFGPGKVPNAYRNPVETLFGGFRGYSSGNDYADMDKAEKQLQREMKEDSALVRLYALVYDHPEPGRVLRVYRDRATLTSYHGAYYREKTLTKEELQDFDTSLAEIDVDNFNATQGDCHYDCATREFIRLERQGGLRVFANSAALALGSLDAMGSFYGSEDFKTHFFLEKKIKGLEVLLAGENGMRPLAVWTHGSDIRVLISDKGGEDEVWKELSRLDNEDRKNEELGYEALEKMSAERRAKRMNDHLSWRKVNGNKLAEPVAEPRDIPFIHVRTTFPDLDDFRSNDNPFRARTGSYELRPADSYEDGLALVNGTNIIKLSKKGWYRGAVITPDGRWGVVSKLKTNWNEPYSIVRINLSTGKETVLPISPATNLEAVAYVPAQNKVLISSASSHYLFNVNANTLRPVKGEFRPLDQPTYRALQCTGVTGEFWAAIPNEGKKETVIGKYDTLKFVFTPVLTLPDITFDSMDLWIDEQEGFAYFIHGNSFLLRVPFKQSPLETTKGVVKN